MNITLGEGRGGEGEGSMPPKPLEATKDITFAKNLALLPLIEYSILMTYKNFESWSLVDWIEQVDVFGKLP